MPRVRTYGARRVGTAPIPGVRKTAAETPLSTGAGLEAARAETGQQIAGIAEGVARQGAALFGQIQQQERDRADEVALLEASNALARWEQEALYSEHGALSKRGKDSFALPETVNADFERVAGDVAKTMRTPRQQAEFARERANRGLNLSATLHRHVFGERQQYEASELQEGVKNGVNAAIANALDPRRVSEELQGVVGRIKLHGPRAGMSPEAVKAAVRGAQSDVHVGVIRNLLANEKETAAEIYFEAAETQIAGDKLDEVTTALKVGGRKREAQRIADEILLAGGTLTEQREKVRAAVEDPDTRADVMGRLEHEAAVRDRAQRETREARMLEATEIVERTGRVDAIPASLIAQLDVGQRSALRSYGIQRARGIPVETNDAVYYGYLNMATREPKAFMQTNLLDNRHQLDDADFKQLASLQLSLRQGDTRKADEDGLAGFRTKSEILENTLTQYGIPTTATDRTKAENDAIAQLSRMLDRRIEAVQAGGKKATNDEMQAALDGLISQSVDLPVAGVGFFELFFKRPHQKRLIDLTIADVPEATRKAIEAKLRGRGDAVTDVTILDTYIEMQVK